MLFSIASRYVRDARERNDVCLTGSRSESSDLAGKYGSDRNLAKPSLSNPYRTRRSSRMFIVIFSSWENPGLYVMSLRGLDGRGSTHIDISLAQSRCHMLAACIQTLSGAIDISPSRTNSGVV